MGPSRRGAPGPILVYPRCAPQGRQMCPMQNAVDDRPCSVCGSENHGTGAHGRLERAYAKWGLGLTSSADQPEIDLAGAPGAPSPSTNDSVRPDRLRIVPFTISGPGTTRPYKAAAILRQWSRDPEGGCTFTLSWAQFDHPSLERSLARLFGDRGITVSVELDSNHSRLTVGPLGTSPST